MIVASPRVSQAGLSGDINVDDERRPSESLQPLVMIECPRLLFPFAREIVATATRNGGFPPLMLEPVDFAARYRDRRATAQQPHIAVNPS